MNHQTFETVQFAHPGKRGFHQAVTTEVNAYFRNNKLSPYANREMWVKTGFMLLLFFVPYTAITTGAGEGNLFIFFTLWFIMSLGKVGLGACVVHDANHGTYSANKKINNLLGYTLDIIGGFAVNWKIQHNYLHHTFTNIEGMDEDIDSMKFLRLSPRQPRYKFHRYQHIYFWIFYMLLTLFWMTIKDYLQAIRYHRHQLLIRHKLSFSTALVRITLFKTLYYGYIIALPILFSGVQWYYVIMGFLLMHFFAGFFLSCIFQLAHIAESSGFAEPVVLDGKKHITDSWAVHEVSNTTNFATNNRLLTWFIGGLNYQVEHHLFTGICHVHYPRLAPIVKSVAEQHGIVYNAVPTLSGAFRSHVSMLKKLGRE